MSAHGIVQAAVVHKVASLLCRCGVRVHGSGGAVVREYRIHRALARQHEKARTPGTVTRLVPR